MAKKPKTTNQDTTRVDVWCTAHRRTEYVAKKNFRFQGRPFAIGQEFPWRVMSCSERRVRLLEAGGYIVSGMVWAERGHKIQETKRLPDVVPNDEMQKLMDEFGLTAEEVEQLMAMSEEDVQNAVEGMREAKAAEEAAAVAGDSTKGDEGGEGKTEPATSPEPVGNSKDATGGKDQDNK